MFVREALSVAGGTLLLPALTVGNIGQLSIDLIIASLNVPRVGFIDSPAVVPLCGNDAFTRNQGHLATAVECFYNQELNTLLLQQRAPVLRGKGNQFSKSLLELVKREAVKDVFLISSLNSAIRSQCMMERPIVRVLTDSDENKKIMEAIGCLPLENEYLNDLLNPGTVSERIFNLCKKEGVVVTILVAFCAEGDNLPEATNVAQLIHSFLRAKRGIPSNPVQWKAPPSWSVMFNGSPFDQSMFQ